MKLAVAFAIISLLICVSIIEAKKKHAKHHGVTKHHSKSKHHALTKHHSQTKDHALSKHHSKEKHHASSKHHSRARHQNLSNNDSIFRSHKLNRDAESCMMQCEIETDSGEWASTDLIENETDVGLNWVINLDENTSVAYNAEENFLGIHNEKEGWVVIIDGNTSTQLTVNALTGAGIITNINTGVSVYDPALSPVLELDSNTPLDRIEMLHETLVKNEERVSENIDPTTDENAFSITELIKSISRGEDITNSKQFEGRPDLSSELNANFGTLFKAIDDAIKKGGASVGLGSCMLLAPVLGVGGKANIVAAKLFEILVALKLRTGLIFTPEVFGFIYQVLTKGNDSVPETLGLLEEAFNGLKTFYVTFEDALEAVADRNVADMQVIFVEIDDKVYSITTGVLDKSWLFEISLSEESDDKFDVIVAYSAKSNYLAFYNKNTGYAVVFVGGKSVFGVYNVATGVGLAVNGQGYAKLIETHADTIKNAFISQDYSAGLALIGALVGKTNINITDFFSVFNFKSFLEKLSMGGDISGLFGFASGDLKKKVMQNFELLIDTFKDIPYNNLAGVYNVLGFIFGGSDCGGLANGFIELVSMIYSKLGGFFNADILLQVFNSMKLALGSGPAGSINFQGVFDAITDVLSNVQGGIFSSFFNFSQWASSILSNLEAAIASRFDINQAGSGGFAKQFEVVGGPGSTGFFTTEETK